MRLQPIRVQVYLVLLSETAYGRYLGHAGNGLEVVAQIPILVRTEVRQAVPPGSIHQHVLENPAQAGGVRAQLSFYSGWQSGKNTGQVFQRA